jgi:dienelactone hydrolase
MKGPFMMRVRQCLSILGTILLVISTTASLSQPLPGTAPLSIQGDIASNLVAGVDCFLLGQIERSVERRARHWHRDFSSPENYAKSLEPNRQRLAHILGLRDDRPRAMRLEYCSFEPGKGPLARGRACAVYRVRWPVLPGIYAEGLLLRPAILEDDAATAKRNGLRPPEPTALPALCVLAIPDADQTPEQIAGLAEGVPPEAQFARRLAESGCQVLVPTLINRRVTHRKLANREFLYRPAFELGRHIIGYELQKILAGVDCLARESTDPKSKIKNQKSRIGVIGWGEGGLLAFYAGALDSRLDAVAVSGYFDRRQNVWQEPVYRNVFGLLEQFGDAELASMIAPRTLIIEAAKGPEIVVPPGTGGAPGRLVTPKLDDVRAEFERAKKFIAGLKPVPRFELVVSGDGAGPFGSDLALEKFLEALAPGAKVLPAIHKTELVVKEVESDARQARQMLEIERHTQHLLTESPYIRQKFMSKLDTSSLEKYEQSVAWYREFFYDEVIGRFDHPLLPPNVRSRKIHDQPKWTGYEVVLDVFPEVIAYGILLLPKDMPPGEKRPAVVCQHGLEGRPQHVVSGDNPAYHDFAAKLAERGFVTFAPQNLYIFGDHFRTLQRKANPLKKTLFSIITPQHQQIVNWLKSLPFVDGQRIGFYGLSYGGKTAMRVPALVTDYCLSICSADFNEWVWKNASTRSSYSYVWTGEYEIFEFDLGSTFNYAEMAALIAPRPFMVERGHFDGVAPDEAVAYEYAKVRHIYSARLHIGDRTQIEWFVGPHTINGQGTFDFLHKHLNWPR